MTNEKIATQYTQIHIICGPLQSTKSTNHRRLIGFLQKIDGGGGEDFLLQALLAFDWPKYVVGVW